jgi:hypothetical protein
MALKEIQEKRECSEEHRVIWVFRQMMYGGFNKHVWRLTRSSLRVPEF